MCGWRLGSFTSSANEAWADFGPGSSARSASGLGLANGHAGTTSAEAWEAVLALGWDRGVNCSPEYADASGGGRPHCRVVLLREQGFLPGWAAVEPGVGHPVGQSAFAGDNCPSASRLDSPDPPGSARRATGDRQRPGRVFAVGRANRLPGLLAPSGQRVCRSRSLKSRLAS